MASFITRGFIVVLGYALPAYRCFKSAKLTRPDAKLLQFWCQYWIIIAVLTILESFGETFISWLPMYNEAKACFVFFLWHPKTKGTTYIYSSFVEPIVLKHELEIDRHLNEFWTRASDMIFHCWQRGSVYAQSRLVDILQYIASQSPPAPPAPSAPVAPPASPAPSAPVAPAATPVRPPAQVPAAGVYRSSPRLYQRPQPQPSLLNYPQISSGYHEQHLAYQAQVQTNKQYEPTAPILPSRYEAAGSSPGAAAVSCQQSAMIQQPFEVDQDVIEITGPNDGMSEPSLQRRRSRSRSRTYRP